MSHNSDFRIVLFYEDLVSGIRGSTVLKRLSDQLDAESENLESEILKLEMLHQPDFRSAALERIAGANMIVISAAGAVNFPGHIREYFERALSLRGDSEAAIVALLDWDQAPTGEMPPLGVFLRELATKFGLDFFCNKGEWQPRLPRDADPAISEFEDDYGALRVLAPWDTGARGWGIND